MGIIKFILKLVITIGLIGWWGVLTMPALVWISALLGSWILGSIIYATSLTCSGS